MGAKSVETLGSKIRFLSVFVTFSPLPPKTMLIFLFLRLHRLQRLHNIKLGGRGIRELTLDANKVEKCLSIEKRDFLKVSQLLLSLIIAPGDKVLVKQERKNKLSTPFSPEPFDVVTKTGNGVVVESPGGVQLMRNATHVKKYEETSQNPEEATPLRDVTDPVEPEVKREKLSSPGMMRSRRVGKVPERFKDFVMT